MSQEYEVSRDGEGVDPLAPPAVIVLGNAAALTRGSDQDSTESKQTPYD
nr:albusnodin family lasso peptide [Streptomyces murinus]